MEYSNKPSPWEKAIEKLPAQSQKEFDFHNSDGLLKVLDDVLKATNTARETCQEKMWKISWKGKNIVLRDIADKTIEWVNKFKTLGNVIAQGDPVHAAIPWFIIKDHQKMGEMLVGIEVITNLMGRCAIYEELYLGTSFDTAQRVEEALVALYADMLTYMINAKHYYAENTIVRIAWGVLDTDGPAEALTALQAKESKVFEESHLAGAKNQSAANMIAEERYKELQMLLNEFKMPIVRIERDLEILVDGLEVSKRKAILDWISKTPYTKYHRTAKKNRTEGTCDASGLLWLRGDPGAGKTPLTSMVVDTIDQKQNLSRSDENLAYFYCKRGEGLLNDPTEIMRSILRQLSFKGPENALQEPVVAEYKKSTAGKTLDDGPGIKNARNDDDIKIRFESAPNIYIEETDNAMDIRRYINEELSGCIAGGRLLRGKVEGSLKELIISKLLEKARGMFLWVELQIKELCALSLEKDVREMLDNFPSSLEETYKDIYERIQRKKGTAPKIAKSHSYVNAQGGRYGNALQAAAYNGHEKIVQMLLDRGADVNAQGGLYGNTLQAAASLGREKVVQMLLDRGADVNAQGGLYRNALQAATRSKYEKIVEMLLARGAISNEHETPQTSDEESLSETQQTSEEESLSETEQTSDEESLSE
ncbi:uncharacterized protein H6S33_008727 [Morchella sextelata]|uniref:uncharacterized protein n=1 Tax=Morchella sextelata TaxID=1174677 RepID=UPI001D04F40B|nr:uncharacterized protein H6S33_008727 [Morchella sextelata]KAH0602388.1 hypothetical protein H6S33_008727 [Morchella sextelata]